MSHSGKNDFLLGVLVGAAAGAAAALLYAPAPGSETREQVKSVAGDAMDRAADVASSVKDRAVDVASTVKDRASDLTSKAQDVASSVKDQAADVATRVKSQAQDLAARGQDKVKDATDQVSDFASDMKDKVTGAAQPSGASSGKDQENWAAELPETSNGDKTGHRDLHTLETSDEPDVVTDRINDAMQGSGTEAHKIAEGLAQAPGGGKK